MIKQIMTTLGPIDADQLGTTSMHDHIMVDAGFFGPLLKRGFPNPSPELYPDPMNLPLDIENLKFLGHGHRIFSDDNWDLTDVDLMTEELSDFRKLGGQSILETSVPGIRRNVAGLKKIAINSNVNIIASTGLYVENSWTKRFLDMEYDDYIEFMKREIFEGIEDTGIKAGHIKTAILESTAKELEFIRAAASVSNETGYLVTAHTSSMTSLEARRRLLQNFLSHGMQSSKLLFCHMQFSFFPIDMKKLVQNPDSWKLNLDWAKEVLDAGVNICIDLFGPSYDLEALDKWEVPDMVKMAGLLALIKEGYSDQIVIGNDLYQKIMTRRFGGHGYCRILNFVVPTLRTLGVRDDDIEKIMIINPMKMLSV